jgi:hypothetical protein
MLGMLLHIDGSKHQWLNNDRWHDLIVILGIDSNGDGGIKAGDRDGRVVLRAIQ